MAEPAHTFFIAHAGRDVAAAKELCGLLRPGVSVFLDACDLAPGDRWDVELPRHQRGARATVAVLSASVDDAFYLKDEMATAIALHRAEPNAHRLIPVYLDGVPPQPPYGLRGLHALDAKALGMTGVAAKLKQLAADLEQRPLPPEVEPTAGATDRHALYDALCRLLPAMFDEILFRVEAPTAHLAPANQPLAARARDLVQWAQLGGRGRMEVLARAIQQTAPGVLR